jgi:DNA-binding transcriptional ArsR family regulator
LKSRHNGYFGKNYFYISRNMVDMNPLGCYLLTMKLDSDTAASLFGQLGNSTRLNIVRMLVRAGREGLPVGEIQSHLVIPGSTLSHHLTHLRSVGLIWQEREGAVLRCFVDYKKLEDLAAYLMEECCTGIPTLEASIELG